MLWPRLRGCVRSRIVRAFLIEEQKCVKQVLAEKLSQAKEKESGGHLDLADDVDGVKKICKHSFWEVYICT